VFLFVEEFSSIEEKAVFGKTQEQWSAFAAISSPVSSFKPAVRPFPDGAGKGILPPAKVRENRHMKC